MQYGVINCSHKNIWNAPWVGASSLHSGLVHLCIIPMVVHMLSKQAVFVTYSTLCSLSLLNLWFCTFHYCGKVLGHWYLTCFFCSAVSLFSFQYSNYTYIIPFEIVSQSLNALFCSFLSLLVFAFQFGKILLTYLQLGDSFLDSAKSTNELIKGILYFCHFWGVIANFNFPHYV